MALTTSRISVVRGRPNSRGGGNKASVSAHSHPSRRLHSADHRGDSAVEWFQSTSCAPVSLGNQMDTQVAEITQFILGKTLTRIPLKQLIRIRAALRSMFGRHNWRRGRRVGALSVQHARPKLRQRLLCSAVRPYPCPEI
jgi:hypothetical protein